MRDQLNVQRLGLHLVPQLLQEQRGRTPHPLSAGLALLKEAGIDPATLSFTILTNERKERVDMAQIIQSQLAELGIKTDIKQMEWGSYLGILQQRTHDVFLLGWGLSVPDPNYAVAGLLATGAGTNYTGFSNKELDELLAKGRSLQDGDERKQVYKDMQLFIRNLGTNLFFREILGQYLTRQPDNYMSENLKTLSNFFKDTTIEALLSYSKLKEDKDFVFIAKESTLNRDTLDELSMIRQYDELYKPKIKYNFTEYDYTYHVTIKLNKNDGLIENSSISLTEKIKNNMVCSIHFDLKRVEI